MEAPAARQSGAEPATARQGAARRALLAQLPYDELTRSLLHTFIGASAPHRAQSDALEALGQGMNTLAVMGTGRGKSLIFQVHAVREAVINRCASVLVYPLRALVADQAFHLIAACTALGVRAAVLTGESLQPARDRAFAELAAGSLDIVLTTPEFLAIHAERFTQPGRVGFVVVDEAHHAARARSGERSAYLELPHVFERLGSPTVLAVTATADAHAADEICQLLISGAWSSIRPSARTSSSRTTATSRPARTAWSPSWRRGRRPWSTSTRVTKRPSSRARFASACPSSPMPSRSTMRPLAREDRTRIEEAFRAGALECIVSTSAFGEGVNLPDIRHVVLYHMPFSATEFNQMSGRAGRDGEPATVHLLYSARDARINERMLDAAAPEREELVTIYRALQTMWRSHRGKTGEESFSATDLDISNMCLAIDARTPVDERAVKSGIAIFEELGIARVEGFDDARRIEMSERPGHMSLTSSTRYLEGLRTRLAFTTFRGWALDAPAHDMLARVNRPITP